MSKKAEKFVKKWNELAEAHLNSIRIAIEDAGFSTERFGYRFDEDSPAWDMLIGKPPRFNPGDPDEDDVDLILAFDKVYDDEEGRYWPGISLVTVGGRDLYHSTLADALIDLDDPEAVERAISFSSDLRDDIVAHLEKHKFRTGSVKDWRPPLMGAAEPEPINFFEFAEIYNDDALDLLTAIARGLTRLGWRTNEPKLNETAEWRFWVGNKGRPGFGPKDVQVILHFPNRGDRLRPTLEVADYVGAPLAFQTEKPVLMNRKDQVDRAFRTMNEKVPQLVKWVGEIAGQRMPLSVKSWRPK